MEKEQIRKHLGTVNTLGSVRGVGTWGDELSGGPREGAACRARRPSAFLASGTALGLGLVLAAKGG